MKVKHLEKYFVALNVIILTVSILINDAFPELLPVRPLGIALIYIMPIIGIIGGLYSIYCRQWFWALLNFLFIFSFILFHWLIYFIYGLIL